MDIQQFSDILDNALLDLSIQVYEGYPILENQNHIEILKNILINEYNMDEIFISTLFTRKF